MINIKHAPPHEFVYIVRQGDTLHEIALRYHTTVKEIVKWNDIQDPKSYLCR